MQTAPLRGYSNPVVLREVLLAVACTPQGVAAADRRGFLRAYDALDVVFEALGDAAQALHLKGQMVGLLERRAVHFLRDAFYGALREAQDFNQVVGGVQRAAAGFGVHGGKIVGEAKKFRLAASGARCAARGVASGRRPRSAARPPLPRVSVWKPAAVLPTDSPCPCGKPCRLRRPARSRCRGRFRSSARPAASRRSRRKTALRSAPPRSPVRSCRAETRGTDSSSPDPIRARRRLRAHPPH